MTYMGIDLAWSSRNPTGIAVITTSTIHTDRITTDDAIINFIKQHQPIAIGIDAPLTVPNQTGRRGCDHTVSQQYKKYHAGVYPANRTLLASYDGNIRGELLVQKLQQLGYRQDPTMQHTKPIIEVYPHASMINLFNLTTIIPYKKRKNRSPIQLTQALMHYYHLTEQYLNTHYHLSLATTLPLLSNQPLSTSQHKSIEDKLDAVLCAIITHIAHTQPQRQQLFGNLPDGHIMVVR